MIRFVVLCLLAALLPAPAFAQDDQVDYSAEGDLAWVVNDYRYVPASDQDDPVTGLSLCGTRCNAMTTDARNIIDARGFRYIRVARDVELSVPLDNPFMGGHCICTADEYRVRVNEFNGKGQNRD